MSAAVAPATAAESRPPAPRHFLEIRDFDGATLRAMLEAAKRFKEARQRLAASADKPLAGRALAMIFEKPSTRTRVSFEIAMRELGGETIVLSRQDMQLGRGETIADTARVLSRYVHAILLRTDRAQHLTELARHAGVPVINGLTDLSHPCQILADILTFEEHRGPIEGQTLAWCGDGNNVARSLIEAAVRLRFRLRLATPAPLAPPGELLDWARAEGGEITLTEDPREAVRGARAVFTDTWVSMADEHEAETRRRLLAPYQVTPALMGEAAPDALFLHCLPAHRGEEVTDEVIDGPQSVVFDEAENRLHVQKAILAWVFGLPL